MLQLFYCKVTEIFFFVVAVSENLSRWLVTELAASLADSRLGL